MVTNAAISSGSEQRRLKIASVLGEIGERRTQRETIDIQAIAQQHPELMPELGIQLAAMLAQDSGASTPTPQFQQGIAPALLIEAFGDMENIECLDNGAQGYIYKARHRPTKREVAIKVILNGPAATHEQRHRFRKEVELIARLQHPNIVRVYDSGEAMGCSFIIMEHIRGLRIDDYACVEQLPVRRIVELLITVCDAVDFAHKHAVLHRDLKPSNILIDEAGQPHVLDFGLAKDMDSSAEASLVSLTGQVVGTLPYLSPDQVRGETSNVQTDVYALGVILFELLTGDYPYPITDDRFESLSNIVVQEPHSPRKKLGTEPNGLIRAADVNSDLERVTLKALEKDPSRRYATAADFADDLRRYLAGEAVRARTGSRLYLLRKTVRKHRFLFGSLAVVMLVLVGALVGVTSAWRQADRVAKIAMAGMEMASLLKVGGVERDAGRLKEAAVLHQKVIEIGNSTRSDDVLVLRQLCVAHQRLIEDRIEKGQLDSAAYHVERANEIAASLVQKYPEDPILKNLKAFSLIGAGNLALRQKDYNSALQAYSRAAAIQEELLNTQPYSPTLIGDVAHALGLRGSAARKLGKMDIAIESYSKSYEIMKKLHDEAPAELARSLDLARAESKMAIAYLSMKSAEYDAQAESWLGKASARLEECKKHERASQRAFTIDQLAYEINANQSLLNANKSSIEKNP